MGGTYQFISQDGKSVKVRSARGDDREFSVSAVKPYEESSTLYSALLHALSRYGSKPVNGRRPSHSEICRTIIVEDPADGTFDKAKRDEINGLLSRGAFKIVERSAVPKGANVLRGRFVLAIKEPDTERELLKTRFVVQGHRDREKGMMVKESPTVLRHSIRLLIALASVFRFTVWTRDVRQAYIQSAKDLLRDVYLEPPPDVGIDNDCVLKIMKPLYGLTESGSYWWLTSQNYHVNDLGMSQSVMDPCLFFKNGERGLEGLEASLVDDTLGTGDEGFMRIEEEKSKRFDVKERETGLQMTFNGCVIKDNFTSYTISQHAYTSKLRMITRSQWNEREFPSLRGRISWITNLTRPDAAFCTAYLSQKRDTNVKEEDFKLLNATVKYLMKNDRGLIYPQLDLQSLKIRAYADAAFGGNDDHSSQLGMIILLCDDLNNCAVIHYNSWKCQRVTRSVLAAEVHAFSAYFDFAFALRHDLRKMINIEVPVVMFTDSKCLFDTITRFSGVTEKRLLIDISALRQSYNRGEIFNVGHVSSEYNLANPLSKKVKSDLLEEVMTKGKLSHPVNQWIVHQNRKDNLSESKDGAAVKRETGGCRNNDKSHVSHERHPRCK